MNAARILAALLGAAALALALPALASANYGWPVKPFDKAHPVRGQLNDPRMNGLVFDSSSSRTFHTGVDIAAPDGTAVYAVAPGQVHYINQSATSVRGKNGAEVFRYWHLRLVVKNNVSVKLHALLGYIQPGRWHVHFSEKRNGRYVDPLRRGGITPYSDNTRPTIASISYYDNAYHDLDNAAVSGAVRITVNAYDTPQLVSNWPWAVVTPAWIEWQLFDGSGQKIKSGHWDFRTLCALSTANVFAPGIQKNGAHVVGSYNYWIGPKWDTTLVPNGTFRLIMTVADERENEATRIASFTVANEPAAGNPAPSAPATS